MSKLFYMVTISTRSRLKDFMSIYKERGIEVSIISLGYGTASNDMMNYLGLQTNEKAVVLSFVTEETWKKTKADLKNKLYIGSPNTGVAFVVPVASFGGVKELEFFTQNQSFEKGEESTLKDTKQELLMVICNQGFNESVMDAAREAGAKGGTVIHAQGTGMESAEKFFGISLATEKDVILIVTRTDEKKEIMRAIMEKCGMKTKGKAICFSLPVTDTAGLPKLEEAEEE